MVPELVADQGGFARLSRAGYRNDWGSRSGSLEERCYRAPDHACNMNMQYSFCRKRFYVRQAPATPPVVFAKGIDVFGPHQ